MGNSWGARKWNLLRWLSSLTDKHHPRGGVAPVGLGRSRAPSPPVTFVTETQDSSGPTEASPPLPALQSLPGPRSSTEVVWGTPGSLGGGHSWDRIPRQEPGPELRLPGSQSPSLPDHSVLCSLLPHTYLPSFLPSSLPPSLAFHAGPRWSPDKSGSDGGSWGERGRWGGSYMLASGDRSPEQDRWGPWGTPCGSSGPGHPEKPSKSG